MVFARMLGGGAGRWGKRELKLRGNCGDSSQSASRCNSTEVKPILDRLTNESASGAVRVTAVAQLPSLDAAAWNHLTLAHAGGN